MVLGGDMTGKALVPIVEDGPGHWHATLLENRREFESEDEVKEFEDSVMRRGYYPFRTDPDEMSELTSDEDLRNELFYKEMLGTIERWMRMADEKLEGTGIDCFVSPGNDDQFEVDEIISSARRVRLAEGKVVEFGDFQMISPYGSGLDDAPELTEDLRPKHGGRSIVPVGSTAVRDAIKEGQPALALHGHIHEAKGNTRIGNTLCINPGSSYEQGQLLGAVVNLDGGKKVKRFVLTSG
jgi:Icc-related predicted phosphoesterase